jgi:hypothetical protein
LEVIQTANRFYQEKTRKPDPQPDPIPQSTPTPATQPIQTVSIEKVHRARNKVVNASNSSSAELKNALLQILEEFPQTAGIIDNYLK